MIKYKKNCKVCNTIKEHKKGKKIAERIYFSTYFNPTGTESLQDIANSHPNDFSYDSLRNHVKKHQFISESQRDQKLVDKIQERSERAIVEKVAEHTDVRNLVMNKGFEGIQSGDIKLSASNVLQAAKDQANWESKQADRQLAMMEMVYHYASGEATNSHAYDRRIIEAEEVSGGHLTESTEGDSDTGETRPSSVHRGIIGAPPTPRSESIPESSGEAGDEDKPSSTSQQVG